MQRIVLSFLLIFSFFANAQTRPHKDAGPLMPANKFAARTDWWKHAVVYEIYPRSYGDSNNDGTGDLNGITQHLDHLAKLGVDAIWITPCFPSPQVDFGYDVADYTNIEPMYGTLADFDRLVQQGRKRQIRVVLDFVVNHSSDQHPWFLKSKASRQSEYRDWYIWRDGKPRDPNAPPLPGIATDPNAPAGEDPPNTWTSLFGAPP